jgi:hypothetical protein
VLDAIVIALAVAAAALLSWPIAARHFFVPPISLIPTRRQRNTGLSGGFPSFYCVCKRRRLDVQGERTVRSVKPQ